MFRIANPVFLKDLDKEKNITAFFAANFDCSGEKASLFITGETKYRITVNGEFAGYGPENSDDAKSVDFIDISPFVSWGLNQIVIEIVSYNLNAKFPGFLQAEVYADGKVVAATGHNFIGFVDVERVQKVMRISSERGFSEVYNRKGSTMFKVPIEIIDAKIPLKLREAPIDNYKIVNPSVVKYKGTFLKEEKEIADRFNKKLESFKENEIEFKPIYDMCKMKYIKSESESKISYPYTLKKGEYIVFSMGENLSGFIRHKIKAIGNTKMIIGVTNDDYSGDFFPFENGNVNVIDYEMTGGEYEGETIESYDFEFLYMFAIEGEIEIDEVSVRKII